jgi:hypothetical protein
MLMTYTPSCFTRLLALLLLTATPGYGWAQEAPPPTKPHPPSLFAEPAVISEAVEFASKYLGGDGRGPQKEGFYPAIGGIVTGAGWLSVGPGYRLRIFGDRALVDASAAISWRGYKNAEARLEFTDLMRSRLSVGSEVIWQDFTQINYFGMGPDSLETNRSEYRLKTTDVAGYARYRLTRRLSIAGRVGRIDQPTLSSSAGPFDPDYPDVRSMFPHEPALGLERQPSFVHADSSVTADWRDSPGHPSSGGLYRASLAVFSDRDLGAFSFRRFEADAAQFVPLLDGGWVLAFHGWGVFSETDSGQSIPVYFLPSIGGSNTLRAYDDFRFHDRNLVMARAESRWALSPHMDAALFVDSGGVASRPSDLTLGNTSIGAGFRIHSHTSTTARLDVAHGRAGWRLMFRLNDPFRLRRLEHRSVIPFVP